MRLLRLKRICSCTNRANKRWLQMKNGCRAGFPVMNRASSGSPKSGCRNDCLRIDGRIGCLQSACLGLGSQYVRRFDGIDWRSQTIPRCFAKCGVMPCFFLPYPLVRPGTVLLLTNCGLFVRKKHVGACYHDLSNYPNFNAKKPY